MIRPEAPARVDGLAARQPARANPLVATLRASALIGLTLVLIVVYPWPMLVAGRRRTRVAAAFTSFWSRCASRILGMHVHVRGPVPPGPCMLVPNHISYLDIVAMAGVAPCFFVPKGEMASWPVISTLTRITMHPFIRRATSKDLIDTAETVASRLRADARMCVFLEGTTTGGDRVLPFRPFLLEPAIATGTPAVPVSITYRARRPDLDLSEDVGYWRDEHVFMPHLWRVMGLGGIDVEIAFGEPVATSGRERKELGLEMRERVGALTGLGDEQR